MIALSDQDDVWRNDKLQLIEESLNRAPQAGLVFSDADVVDENLSPLNRRMWDEVNFDAHKRKLVQLGRAIEVLITGWRSLAQRWLFALSSESWRYLFLME